MVLVPGADFAGFIVEELLGRGGMGEVYRARHPRLPRQVAVKVLTDIAAQDESFRLRFDREADLAARTNHRNIVTVYDRGIDAGRPWICMEYVPGSDLSALLRRHRSGLPVDQALYILAEAAAGLDHAHRQGLLHRDIKPANILLAAGDPGERDRVLLSDFGIARSVDESTGLTSTGAFVATIAYAAPETFTADDLDARADVYSLAVTFFEMLTGTVPYPRPTPAAVMHAHLHDPIPTVTDLCPALPTSLTPILTRALAKHPAQRYLTAREFAEAATAALRTPASPPPLRASQSDSRSRSTQRARFSANPADPDPHHTPQPTGPAAAFTPQPDQSPASRPPVSPRPPGSETSTPLGGSGSRRRRRLMFAAVGVVALVTGGIFLAYSSIHPSYYVGADNGHVAVFRKRSVLGFTVREVDQRACVTANGDAGLSAPDSDFPSGCRVLSVSDLQAGERASVNAGLPDGSRDQSLRDLWILIKGDLLPTCEKPATAATAAPTSVAPTAPPLGSPPTTVAPQSPGQNCRMGN
ncbi:protein kinase [Nocardia sp. NPDC059240]|uniref:serine/threonine-protein kinase n=1 Tax=Nocardia sp. NPDC059240 TaxID=3346786 RepID=UPI0036C26C6B